MLHLIAAVSASGMPWSYAAAAGGAMAAAIVFLARRIVVMGDKAEAQGERTIEALTLANERQRATQEAIAQLSSATTQIASASEQVAIAAERVLKAAEEIGKTGGKS